MQIEIESTILTVRLWHEVIERNRYSIRIHIALILLAFSFSRDMHLLSLKTLVGYGFVLTGCIVRLFVYKEIKSSHQVPAKNLVILHHFCLTAIGFGWGLYWFDIHEWYGRFSIHGLFAFLILTSFIAAAVPANSPRPTGYICFATTMAMLPIYDFLTQGNYESKIIAGCFVFYVCFNIYQMRISYQTISKSIDKDLQINNERENLQTLINAVPGYVCFIDKNLRYIMVNENARACFKLDEYIGRSILEDNPNSDFVNLTKEFMAGDKKTTTSELKFETNPGNIFSFVSIQKIQEPQGGAVVVAIPMDELIETRKKIKDQEAKSFYTSKLISLGEMAAGIAHEINNPLAIIMGCSDQILRVLKKPELQLDRVETLTQKIQSTVERISLIIKSLRILSRNGEKDPYLSFRIDSLLAPSIEISRQRFSEVNIKLDIILPEHVIHCYGQEIQLSQVMMNLLSNAFDAASEGQEPRWVRLEIKSEGKFIDILVQDSGLGIASENKDKIMNPFFTTKAINKGTGLGLSISKSIIEQHGGSLTLDETSTNTTFIMRIPQAT
ncbi:MAG: GHKL domain-containing protein [Bdellovibrionales bacterium]|nr:GHKL domain-containing protein [Bdellovibrionales bacterium]